MAMDKQTEQPPVSKDEIQMPHSPEEFQRAIEEAKAHVLDSGIVGQRSGIAHGLVKAWLWHDRGNLAGGKGLRQIGIQVRSD